ncbi:ABC transporter substrate-binding protein [Pseudothermotoga elfii]|nr:peptide/nickel transport system substrate-binding protein [Pseudothermotoga sp.]
MRKLAAFLFAVVLSVAIFASPNYNSVIRVGSDQNPTTMDPAMYQDLASAQVMRNVFETLVAYDADVKEIHPLIAESWEVSADLKEWTFKLKKGVRFQKGKFQNGREVTAEDVKYSFEREISISPMVRLYMVEKVEVIDRYTVKIVLKYPYAPFLTVLTDIGAAIVPKEECEGWGEEFTLHPVGTGPFKLVEWVKDSHMVFERNEDYWDEKPYLKQIVYKFIPDKSVLTVALLSGEVDITSDILDQDIPKVKSNPNVDPIMVGGCNVYAVYLNSSKGPTTDKKVREAFFRGIDVQQLVKVIFPNGTAEAAYGPIPTGSWAYNPNVKSFYPNYDPEKAKQLLKEAGYENQPVKLTIYTPEDPNRRKAAVIIQSMLKKIGFDIEVQSLEWGAFTATTSKGEADAYTIGWTWYPDPEFFIFYMFHSSRKSTYGNGGGYNNPEVDKYIELGESSVDQNERTEYYRKAEELIMKDMYYFPLWHKLVVNGVNKKVHGYKPSPDMTIRLYAPGTNVWVEQ